MGRKACEKGDSSVAPAFQVTVKGEESRLELRIRHSRPGVKKALLDFKELKSSKERNTTKS